MSVFTLSSDRDNTIVKRDGNKEETVLKGGFVNQANKLVTLVMEEKPSKIVIRNHSFSIGLMDMFIMFLQQQNTRMLDDGSLIYRNGMENEKIIKELRGKAHDLLMDVQVIESISFKNTAAGLLFYIVYGLDEKSLKIVVDGLEDIKTREIEKGEEKSNKEK